MNEMYNRQGLEHVTKLVDVDSKIKATRAVICSKLSEMQIRLNCVQVDEIDKNKGPTAAGSQRPVTISPGFNGKNVPLAPHPIELLERERNILSKELHDGLLSSLGAIKLKLEVALLEKADFQCSIEETIGHIDNTIMEIRNLSENLRFSNLDQKNLFSKIRRFCKMIEDCHEGLKIENEIGMLEEKIPVVHKIVIYRVLQEAVSNSVKHGEADRINFKLGCQDGKIVFSIADNGDGFETQGIPDKNNVLHGNGLTNMRERVEAVGGTFEIFSHLGKGTCITVSLPRNIDF